MSNTATRTVTLPATITVSMLVRDSSNETLRAASTFEIADAAACVARRGYSMTTIRTCDGQEIPCRVETVTRPMTDAEYNTMLDEVA